MGAKRSKKAYRIFLMPSGPTPVEVKVECPACRSILGYVHLNPYWRGLDLERMRVSEWPRGIEAIIRRHLRSVDICPSCLNCWWTRFPEEVIPHPNVPPSLLVMSYLIPHYHSSIRQNPALPLLALEDGAFGGFARQLLGDNHGR